MLGGTSGVNFGTEDYQYLVSTSLIVSGLLSAIQMTRFHIYGTKYYVGTGLLSVVGMSSLAYTPGDTGIPHTNCSLQVHPSPQLPSLKAPSPKCTKQATVLPPRAEPNFPALRAMAPSSEHPVYVPFSKSVSRS